MKINLPPLHPGQKEVAEHDARFKVLACGRRFGKTKLAALLCTATALEGGLSWWVAPSFSIASIGWRMIKNIARQIPGAQIREVEKRIELSVAGFGSEAAIQVKSADDPTSLRGEGLDLLATDETAFIAREAWYESLRPALSDKQGRALMIGTPKGQNWFFDEWTRGQDPLEPDYASWQFESRSNPFFPPEEWEVAKRNLPEDVFDQEYRALFLTDAAGVFRKLEGILDNGKCEHKNHWVIGADIAKHTDFTVLIVMCRKCGRCCEIDRFQKIDWELQKGKIQRLSRKYGARVYLDATGIGDPIYDDLKSMRVPVEGVKLSLSVKTSLIQKLVVDIEQVRIKIPSVGEHWPEVYNELRRYEYTYSQRGALSYSAPQGYHDDCFGAGTMILTEKGQVPVELIRVGDLVVTRAGLQPVVMTRQSRKPLIRHLGLTGTPTHPVITTSGEKPLQHVCDGDILYVWNEKRLSIEERSTTDIPNLLAVNSGSISGDTISGRHRPHPCTGRFGRTSTDQFQPGMSSITRTEIRETMRSGISVACQEGSIAVFTPELPRRGSNPERTTRTSSWLHQQKNSARNAERPLLTSARLVPGFAAEDVSRDLGRSEEVFNLQVANYPEYFANGILVHNCVIALALANFGRRRSKAWVAA